MKTLIMLLLTITLVVPTFANTSAGDKPLSKQKWSRVMIEASVEKIDAIKREVTLKRPQGELVTITVADTVKRFDEIKVGDTVKTEYWTFLRAEFRAPTAQEKAMPYIVITEAGKAPKEVDPAGVVGAVVKAVVEVVAINTQGKRVGILGPRGNFLILPVLDEAVLGNLRTGETVIMTYAQAMAISLVKSNQNKE